MIGYEAAVKGLSIEALEAAFIDASKRAQDGREINNIPYAEKQEGIARIISDEILQRKLQQANQE